MTTFAIVNPQSRLGETGQRAQEIEALLSKYVGPHELLTTTCEGDGERLAHEARARGATHIIVAGGDGTVSEVVTGLLAETGRTDIVLGILPLGTGRDFARLLGLGRQLEAAVARFAQPTNRKVDAGRIRYRAPDGSERLRCFLNIASFGLSGESALWLKQQAARGKRNALSYVKSTFVGLARYGVPAVTLRLDGEVIHDEPLLLATAANGQYFAGGMQIAPRAQIDDGAFDVVIVPKLRRIEALGRLPLLLRGSHVDGRKVRMQRGRVLEASSEGSVWIEADGEPIGTLPARFELLPQALSLYGVP